MKKRILVIDDDKLICYGLKKALNHGSNDVETASTASEALLALTACSYDLCLLDIRLPDFNSYKMMRIVRDICPKIKIIVMTASFITQEYEFSAQVDEAMRNGACYFIYKPFDLRQLKDIVERVLRDDRDFSNGAQFDAGHSVITQRKQQRKKISDKIHFSIKVIDQGEVKRWFSQAETVDINDDGIGLMTHYPLEVSQIIGFDEDLGKKSGVVVWSRMLDDQKCRAGVRFA
ncbi:MAG: response regulator [Desulfobulbaceae bacterium]|nr:response regulator [Desulfobulbaceae bacterium]